VKTHLQLIIIIIIIIKSRRMRWAGHVARLREARNAYRFWWESQKERDHGEDQGLGGWTILKWNFQQIKIYQNRRLHFDT
jgi:hypothetical protein